MRFHPADPVSLGLFCLLILAMFTLIFRVFLSKGATKTQILGFCGLTATAIIFAVSGLFERNPFPLLPIFMLFLLGSAVVFGTSEFGGRVARGYSLSILVGFQSFRLPLELILHNWAETGVIPSTMSWNGQNFDVLTGILALFCSFFVNKSKVTAWIFNGIGALLLMNVIRVVVLSAPLPISWHLENPFQLPFHFPYVLIAPLCVWPACVGHVVLARALMTQK